MPTTRIQRRRTKGWRLPARGICITRPGPYGNPFSIATVGLSLPEPQRRQFVVDAFRWWLMFDHDGIALAERAKRELRGKQLACFCPLTRSCHGDILCLAADGKLWKGWHLVPYTPEQLELPEYRRPPQPLIHVVRRRGGCCATLHSVPALMGVAGLGSDHPGERRLIPRRIDHGYSVLGIWPSEEAAVDAAKAMLVMREEPRLCDLRDIREARKERRRMERKLERSAV